MSATTVTATPIPTRNPNSTLKRVSGINVMAGPNGQSFMQFDDAYAFAARPRKFRLVDQSKRLAELRTAAQGNDSMAVKNLPAWDVYEIDLKTNNIAAKPITGAWETLARDQQGKPHGRINFTDPITHRRYVLFVYSEPQPTPNGGASFHGSASVDLGSGPAATSTLSRFGQGTPAADAAGQTEKPQGNEATDEITILF